MSAHQVHWDPAVREIVARERAAALREFEADLYAYMYGKNTINWPGSHTEAIVPMVRDFVAQQRAAALLAAADHFEQAMSEAWGGASSWLTTGDNVAQLVAGCLRERAADGDA